MLHSELIPAADGSSKRLLVMLHGLGDSIEGYRWLPEAMRLPWLNYLLLNAPDRYYEGFAWFDFTGDMVPGVRRSTKLLFELLDCQRAVGFPTEQTVLGGYSQGCLMAVEVGLRYPHRFAGILGISGCVCRPESLLTELSPVAREQRLFITHGTLDPIVPFAVSRAQFALLKSAGLRIDWREYAKAHTIEGNQELPEIRSFIESTLADHKK